VNTLYCVEIVKDMRKLDGEFFAISFWFRQFFDSEFALLFLVKALTKGLCI